MDDAAAALDALLRLDEPRRLALIASMSESDRIEALYTWRLWARPEQLAPSGIAWTTWLILAGRAWGKTRTGAEWVHDQIVGGVMRVALVARTSADIRDVMVEGESGLLATAHPARRPAWNPSNRRLTWPNGAIATTYSAEEPNSLRGPQHEIAWCDELAAWSYAQEVWDQLQFGLRLGARPRTCVTTTPRPTPLVRALVADSNVTVTRGATYDNRSNLAASFFEELHRKYDGTRLGRQELYAEILSDNPGALWKREQIEALRVVSGPALKRIIVAVDPAATDNSESCECGIIVAGVGIDGHGYILEDLSVVASPNEWGRTVVNAYKAWDADRIVAELNIGGALVEMLLRTIDRNIPYRAVRASRGKAIRAEPVAALYEQGRVHHVGEFPELEDQLVSWDPSAAPERRHREAVRESGTSTGGAMQGVRGRARVTSDRLDALVWALTDLMVEGIPDANASLPRAFPTKFQGSPGRGLGGKFQW